LPGKITNKFFFHGTTAAQIRSNQEYQELKTQILLSLHNKVHEVRQRANFNNPLHRSVIEECIRRYTDHQNFEELLAKRNQNISLPSHTSTETKQEIEEIEINSSEQNPLLAQHEVTAQLDFKILDTLQLLGRDIKSVENIENIPELIQIINTLIQKCNSTHNPTLVCFYTALLDNCFTINKLANHNQLTLEDYKHVSDLSTNRQTDYYKARTYRISKAGCEILKETIEHPEELVAGIVVGPVLKALFAIDAATGYLLEHGLDSKQAIADIKSLYEYIVNMPEEEQDKIIGTLIAHAITSWATARIAPTPITSFFRSPSLIGRLISNPRVVAALSKLATYGRIVKQKIEPCTQILTQAAQKMARPFKQCLGRNRGLATEAILKNGYYEVNGFKFTEYYYNYLWNNGRKAPSLIAQAILDNTKSIIPDPRGHAGFYKYIAEGWEMIYNPTTKIVSHIQPIKK
jgi:hypothetical protein